MKVLVAKNSWIGGVMNHIINGLKKRGHEVHEVLYERQKSFLRTIKVHNVVQVNRLLEKKSWQVYNDSVCEMAEQLQPELFLTFNESFLFPDTVRRIRAQGCETACFIGDNPFDSQRFSYFPVSLRHFNRIFVFDRIWIQNIRNIAPDSRIIKLPSGGGFNPDLFFPVPEEEMTDANRQKLQCDLSFTGESYGMRAEGGYRAGILDQLGAYDVRIWGDAAWKERFPHYDNLDRFYHGGRLSYDELRKLYALSTINLNMPAPQIFSGFQPRVFEIAACKGFQIVDWREELDEWFGEDELVTFKDPADLKEKVDYFVRHPEARKPYIEKMYARTWKEFKWEQQVEGILNLIQEETIETPAVPDPKNTSR